MGRLLHHLTVVCLLAGGLLTGLARADVVVVVAADSPVETLTRAALTDIYLGRLNRFPDGTAAVPVDQSERSPEHEAFYREYLGRTPAEIKSHWSRLIFTGRGRPPRSVRDGREMAEAVAAQPGAIGYLDAALVNDSLRVVRIEGGAE